MFTGLPAAHRNSRMQLQLLFCSVPCYKVVEVVVVVGEGRWRGELTIHLQHMYLAEVLVSIGVAAVVPHVDGGHLGDVQGAVIAKVLQQEEEEESRKRKRTKRRRRKRRAAKMMREDV